MDNPREEFQILEDLAELTTSRGYVHALAKICHRDTAVRIKGRLQASDMNHLFSGQRLIRTELMTLIGLMVKKPLDFFLPPSEVIESYVTRTDALMQELHDAMSYPTWKAILEGKETGAEPPNPWFGSGMREPIFYGSESAYTFQYRDLVPLKLGADDEWLQKNMGFTSGQAQAIARTMCELMNEKGTVLLDSTKNANCAIETWMPAFEFSSNEVSRYSSIPLEIVEAFFRAFLFHGENSGFKEVGDFNEVVAKPLLMTARGTVLLFTQYALYEALYESPFFWMWADDVYRPTAVKHRGDFTENFAARRLEAVFGHEYVNTNVNLIRGKDVVGEIDVLVIYGNRLIIAQAKSKKLTIAARKGNDNQLKADFAAAIQTSYDQGWDCANELLAGGCKLKTASGVEVELPSDIKEIFLFSVISEHYPALALQVSQSLNFQTTDVIRPPFVMDVFLLDTLTEMLATPLRLLGYVRMRVEAMDKLMTGHELNVLGYHLKKNLWLDKKYTKFYLEDSISRDLDAAMLVRRDGLPGADTPQGILTHMRGTLYERLIQEIEKSPVPATLELGFHLLSMDEGSCRAVHQALETITKHARVDGKRHDVTLASASTAIGGICFHCNPVPSEESIAVLEAHCAMRKYQQQAEQWFGVSLSPTGQLQFGVTQCFPWSPSEDMDMHIQGMKSALRTRDALHQYSRMVSRLKLGRNDPCHCGSGQKYKKCCLK